MAFYHFPRWQSATALQRVAVSLAVARGLGLVAKGWGEPYKYTPQYEPHDARFKEICMLTGALWRASLLPHIEQSLGYSLYLLYMSICDHNLIFVCVLFNMYVHILCAFSPERQRFYKKVTINKTEGTFCPSLSTTSFK